MNIQILDPEKFQKVDGQLMVLPPNRSVDHSEMLSDLEIELELISNDQLRRVALINEYIYIRDRDDVEYLNYCRSYG